MRKLKYHEQRLLRKTNFLEWRNTDTRNEHFYISRYFITEREDYYIYKKLVRIIRQLAESIASLPDSNSAAKERYAHALVSRLHAHGLIENKQLVECARIRIDNFCERRLPVLVKRMRMCENLRDAVKFVEQGHVCVGNKRIVNSSVLVSRGMDNYVRWADESKIRRTIKEFNDELDDYETV